MLFFTEFWYPIPWDTKHRNSHRHRSS